jgi:hypothetical protein
MILQLEGRSAMQNLARSKGATVAILLLGMVAVAFVLFRPHLHLSSKLSWIAIIAIVDLAVLSFVAVRTNGTPLDGTAESGDIRKKGRDEASNLRKMLTDLKGREAGEPTQGAQRTTTETQHAKESLNKESLNGEATKTDVVAQVKVALPAVGDEALTAAQRLVAEQRKAAEALLLEACALEERFKSESQAAQAATECAAAKAKAQSSAIAEQKANELAQASSEHRTALAARRKDAEGLVVTMRSAAETTSAQVTELEQQLRDAQRLVEQTLSMVGSHEEQIKELAAEQTAADQKAAEAAALVAACQADRAAAEKEAQAAEERAEALKKSLPATTQRLAGISELEALAARIAEQASLLKRGSQTEVV